MASRARRGSVGSSSARERSASPTPDHRMHYWEIVGNNDKPKSFALAQKDKDGTVKIFNTDSHRYVSTSGAVGRDLLRDVKNGLNLHNVPVEHYISSLRSLGVTDVQALGAKRTRAPAGSSASTLKKDDAITINVTIDGDSFALGSKKYVDYLQYNPEKLIDALENSSDPDARRVGQALRGELQAGNLNPKDKRMVYIDKLRADGRTSRIPVAVGQYGWVQNLLRTGSAPSKGYMSKQELKNAAADNKARRSSSGASDRPPFDISIPAGNPRRGGKGPSLIKYGGPSHIKAIHEGARPETFESLLDAHSEGYTPNQIRDLKAWVREKVSRLRDGRAAPVRRSPSPVRAAPVRARSPSPVVAPVRATSPTRSPVRSTSPVASDFGTQEEEEEEEEFMPQPRRSPPRATPATRVQTVPAQRMRRTNVQQ